MLRLLCLLPSAVAFAPSFLGLRGPQLPSGQCFPSGVPAAQRRNLVHPDGTTCPVGLWKTSFDEFGQTSFAATALVQLVMEEILGFNTTESGTGTWEVEGLYSLLGCTEPFHPDTERCGRRKRHTETHVMVDAYLDPKEWQKVQKYPGAPVKLGSMGYDYFDGQFLSQSAFDAALVAKAQLPLDNYEGLHVKQQPWRYFDPLSSINVSRLGSCRGLFVNLSAYGDDADVGDASSCDGYFWLSPACRSNSLQCIPYFSPFSGWLDPLIAQKAIVWKIPLAIAGSNDLKDFEHLVKTHRCIFSWQRPSSLFGSARPIHFPQHQAAAYGIRNYTTAEPQYPIAKVVSHDLDSLAPQLSQLIRRLQIDVDVLSHLLREHNRTNASWREVACDFLIRNPAFLRRWWPTNLTENIWAFSGATATFDARGKFTSSGAITMTVSAWAKALPWASLLGSVVAKL